MSRGNKLIKGAAVLGMAGLMVKAMGAVFRIPITNWIGAEGMSYYGYAYTIYSVLLVFSTAGIPVALSRMVSERIAVGAYRGAHKVFRTSMGLMFVIGLISFLICFFGAGIITKKMGNPEAVLAVKAISPALLLVPLMSAFRGYFQGRQNMNPTAVSELTEQLGRVLVGLTAAYVLLKVGFKEAAAGASFGASAGALGGLSVMALIYFLNRRVIHRKIDLHGGEVERTGVILGKIVDIAVPIIIGSEMMPIMSFIDTSIIMQRLQATGWTYAEAKGLYGLFSGFCDSLISFPQIFTQAVAVSLVPAVVTAFSLRESGKVKENTELGYRLTMIMAFPCAVGLFVMAEPILLLLYPAQRASAIAAAPTLMIMAVGVIFLSAAQTSTGVLQALGRQRVPVYHLFAGCLGKVVLTYILVGIPFFNIRGAALGTIAAYITAVLLNNRSIKKYTGIRFDYMLIYVKPAFAAVLMGICTFAVYRVTMGFLGERPAVIIAILAGVAVYGVLIFAVKAISLDEAENLPGGTRLTALIRKFVK